METNFFSRINDLNIKGNLRLIMQPQENGEMIVTLLLDNSYVKDKATKQISPLVLSGSITDLNNEFFKMIEEPVKKTNTLLQNLELHEKSLEKAQKESRIEKDKQDALKKDKDGKRKKFDEQMKKVDELVKLKKIGEAIGQLPDLKLFPEFEAEIKKKSQELRSQHGTLSLFTEEPSAASAEVSAEEEETAPEDDDDNEPEDDENFDEDQPNEEDDDNQ